MNDPQHPQAVAERIRTTLQTVAATVTEDSFAAPGPQAGRRRPRRRGRVALGVAAVAIPVTLAAGALVHEGPEYVDSIPPERVVMSGTVDGSRYLLVESDRTDSCGNPVPGVELVEERENLIGSEWNTTGYAYGEETAARCDSVDASRYLEDPALFNSSGSPVGDSFVWVYSVHPDVDTVRITTADGTHDLEVYPVDGAGYAPYEIPEDVTEYSSELVIDGEVVPGSREDRTVRRP